MAASHLRLALSTAVSTCLVMALTACSSPYDKYMTDGCDGLRQMATAYVTADRKQFDDGARQTGNFDPASEEAAGNAAAQRDVDAAWDARRTLYIGAYVPPEYNDGDLVWRHLTLTDKQQSAVDLGLEVCEQH